MYCGHSQKEHLAGAVMVKKPRWAKRWRAGVSYISCLTCAEGLNTKQVMCYQASESWLKALRETGWVVHN